MYTILILTNECREKLMKKKHRSMPAQKVNHSFAKQFRIICFLLSFMLLLYSVTAYALTPTSMPALDVSSTTAQRSIIDSYDVQLFGNGTWSLLEKEMIAVHENNNYYDGILMFIPLSDFVSQTEIPCVRITEDLNYHVIALDLGISLEYSHKIYNEECEIIGHDASLTSEWNKLDSGKYLVAINVFASDEERYASTASLFWLIVGDCDGRENMPVSTPTASPSPSPATSVNDWYWDFGNPEPAYDDKKEAFTYSVLEDGTYSLNSYVGKKNHVEIPEQVNGHYVTEIGSGAFHSNANVTTIILPDTIKKIGESAFGCCTALDTIHLPDSLTDIGECAFFACEALESIVLPEGISSIEKETFKLCTKLNSVTLPTSLCSIGERAFADCSSLSNIELPECLQLIGSRAFSYTCLRNTILPKSLQSVEPDAFHPSFHSLLVYPESYGAVYAQQNRIPYNAMGEDLTEKYSWLPPVNQLDSSVPHFYVRLTDENHAFFALWDPESKESYAVNQNNENFFDCMWKIDFRDQISDEKLNVLLSHVDCGFDTVSFLKPEEMIASLYYPETDDLWEIALHLPVQRYENWLIWNVAIPSSIPHKPDRMIDFSFFNVSEYEITIDISCDSRYEQYIFAADECMFTP